MPRIESQKANKSQKTPKKQYVSKQSTEPYEYKIAKSSSPFVSWKLNTSLTQKDTMDRGSWIKIQRERHAGWLRKDKKVQKHKSAKWHGNEEQMNIFVYHMLQSCGVQDGRYLKIEVKMKFIFMASKELSWLWNLGFHFPKLDYHQWLKVHTFAIWEI